MPAPSGRRRLLIYMANPVAMSEPWALQHARLLSGWDVAIAGRGRPAHPLAHHVPTFRLIDRPLGRTEGAALLFTGRSPRLEGFVRDFDPHLIHAHFGPGGTEVMDIADRLGVPLVVTWHGWDAFIPAQATAPRLYDRIHLGRRSRLLEQAAATLAVSEFLRQRLLALGAPPERTVVHYLGIERQAFAAQVVTAPDRHLIGVVARLIPIKGVQVALEALRILRETVPRVRMEVLGDGPERATLEATARGSRLPVAFLGATGHEAVRDLMGRSRVLCCPSIVLPNGAAEGLGLSVVEAAAAGLPVVATHAGGVPEAVLDGVTGLLVPPGDAVSLASALRRVLVDDSLHAALAATGPAFVAGRFDAVANYRRMAARYEDILSG